MSRHSLPRVVRAAAAAAALVLGGWGALALAVAGPEPAALRLGLAAGFGLVWTVAMVQMARRGQHRVASVALIAMAAALLAWWGSIRPSNARDWAPSVALLPYASVDGDLVTMHNVRHFVYRSETDFTPAYEDRRYDLRKLEAVDVVAVYWMGPAIAHVFLSFAFEGDQHLAVSIETRNERNEPYSAIKGFFRQYELTYVVADERDVIALRTNYRHDPPEDVYVFRAVGERAALRQLFMQYVDKVNALKERPEFYNTLTTNCTTNIWMHTLMNPGHMPFSWKILASGYVPQYLYEQGRLRTDGLDLDALRARAYVNGRARSQPGLQDFSRRIRTQTEARP
jgi:hypothetical protein